MDTKQNTKYTFTFLDLLILLAALLISFAFYVRVSAENRADAEKNLTVSRVRAFTVTDVKEFSDKYSEGAFLLSENGEKKGKIISILGVYENTAGKTVIDIEFEMAGEFSESDEVVLETREITSVFSVTEAEEIEKTSISELEERYGG